MSNFRCGIRSITENLVLGIDDSRCENCKLSGTRRCPYWYLVDGSGKLFHEVETDHRIAVGSGDGRYFKEPVLAPKGSRRRFKIEEVSGLVARVDPTPRELAKIRYDRRNR